jgi:ABC-type sugar transport system ATPase subunit
MGARTSNMDTAVPATGAEQRRPLVQVRELARSFGSTRALRSCSFDVLPGEVHAVVGENGSGKSTLVKILSGVHRPDRGSVQLPDGRERPPLSPSQAMASGIVTVFQEVLVVGPRSVLDNIWIGTDGLWRARRPARAKRDKAAKLLAELLPEPPSLDTAVEDLSLSDRQACAIVRALVRDPKVLILDEATSALDVAVRERLFGIVRRLAADGTGVVFISHRMDEIEELGDRITVMRSGCSVATVPRGEATMRDLVALMTGSDQAQESDAQARLATGRELGQVVLAARGLRLRPDARAFEFEVRAGELVGVAGLEGHGQDAFMHALRGVSDYEGSVVRIRENGGERQIGSPRGAFAQGIAYVPRERRSEALFERMPVHSNFAIPTLSRDSTAGVVSRRRTARRLDEWVSRLGIKLGSPKDPVRTLSGGNQQKIILARWLAADPRILLLNDPTRGVDINAKRDIYELLASLAADGVAVVMLSTEVDEHVELMDRVLVFREHELFAELPRERVSQESLVHAFFGRSEESEA